MKTVGDAPPFWWEEADWRAWTLWPLSAIYGSVAGRRMVTAERRHIPAAVLCVGNLTVGGEGKTPVAIALAEEALRRDLRVGFLSRGHGGSLSEPHLVDATHDSARLVGDEPLLLARHATTVVTPNRVAGAELLVKRGCDFIIMDDGFQSARIHMDYALIVINARRGVGNGHVIPAGPLRARLDDQMRFTDGVVVMGEGSAADATVRHAARAGRAVFSARVEPREPQDLAGVRVLAFAGIGNPEKFYETLRNIGAEVISARSFPDHHLFTKEEVEELASEASELGLQPVTTEKDFVRLESQGGQLMDEFSTPVRALPIRAVFESSAMPAAIVRNTLESWRERMLRA